MTGRVVKEYKWLRPIKLGENVHAMPGMVLWMTGTKERGLKDREGKVVKVFLKAGTDEIINNCRRVWVRRGF